MNLFFDKEVSLKPNESIDTYTFERIKKDTMILTDGTDVVDTEGILKGKDVVFATREPLKPLEVYRAWISKKDIKKVIYCLNHIYYKGKLVEVDKDWHGSFLNVLKLKGVSRDKFDWEFVTPKEMYVVSVYNSNLIDVTKFKTRYVDKVSADSWSSHSISFGIDYDYNNEHLSYVSVRADKFFEEYLNHIYYTKEFREYILEKLELETNEEDKYISGNNCMIPVFNHVLDVLKSNDAWKEEQGYEEYEGYHLRKISLRDWGIGNINKKLEEIYSSFTGTKYTIPSIKEELLKELRDVQKV